jgi:hypothetical protein
VQFADGQQLSAGLHLAVGQPALAQEFHTADFQPCGVDAVVGETHLVGLGIADPKSDFAVTVRHLRSSPDGAAVRRGTHPYYIGGEAPRA